MKKIIVALIASLVLTGCGVGAYSVAGGMSDDAALSVTSTARKTNVTVLIDGTAYDVEAVFRQDFKVNRNIKKTAKNTISVPKGQHDVKVTLDGKEVYNKNILLGAGEHRIIDL